MNNFTNKLSSKHLIPIALVALAIPISIFAVYHTNLLGSHASGNPCLAGGWQEIRPETDRSVTGLNMYLHFFKYVDNYGDICDYKTHLDVYVANPAQYPNAVVSQGMNGRQFWSGNIVIAQNHWIHVDSGPFSIAGNGAQCVTGYGLATIGTRTLIPTFYSKTNC